MIPAFCVDLLRYWAWVLALNCALNIALNCALYNNNQALNCALYIYEIIALPYYCQNLEMIACKSIYDNLEVLYITVCIQKLPLLLEMPVLPSGLILFFWM
jgi:hypothetical protein